MRNIESKGAKLAHRCVTYSKTRQYGMFSSVFCLLLSAQFWIEML